MPLVECIGTRTALDQPAHAHRGPVRAGGDDCDGVPPRRALGGVNGGGEPGAAGDRLPQPFTQLRPSEPVLCPHPKNPVDVDGHLLHPRFAPRPALDPERRDQLRAAVQPGGLAPHGGAPGGYCGPMAIVAVLGRSVGTYVHLALGGHLCTGGVPGSHADDPPPRRPALGIQVEIPAVAALSRSWKPARREIGASVDLHAHLHDRRRSHDLAAENQLVVHEHRGSPKGNIDVKCKCRGARGRSGDVRIVPSGSCHPPTRHGFRWPSLPPSIARVHSADNGANWTAPVEIFIPRQYTPGKQHNAIKLRDGTYAMGIAWDLWAEQGMNARTEGEMNLATGILLSTDGTAWTLHGNLYATIENKMRPGYTNGLCEPSIVQLANGEILMLLRNGSSHHYEARSKDGGLTWSSPIPSTLSGSNTPVALWRNEKKGDEIVAVWNSNPLNRWPLVTALSANGGRTWSPPRILANPGRQASYPGLTQTSDGTFVAVWQEVLADGGRDIRYARYSRDWLLGIR